jgi:hypothetical protein
MVGVLQTSGSPKKIVTLASNDFAGLTDNACSVLQQGVAESLAGFGWPGTSLAQQSCACTETASEECVSIAARPRAQ